MKNNIQQILLSLLILLGIKQAPIPHGCRLIFLRDGRKVIAPAKPDKVAIEYSIIPDSRMDYSGWFEYIRMGGDDSECEVIKKHYL